jgi:hypothetical protein
MYMNKKVMVLRGTAQLFPHHSSNAQARPPWPLPEIGAASGHPSAAAAAGAAEASGRAARLPACAVKLGDGDSGKAQVREGLPLRTVQVLSLLAY